MTFGIRLVTDNEGRIQYRQRAGGRKHFHVAVCVDETDELLDQIRLVEYRLHDSFKEPIRHNDARSDRFEERFYTWGHFMVSALVLFHDGRVETYDFYLDYKLPPDYGLNYVQVPVG